MLDTWSRVDWRVVLCFFGVAMLAHAGENMTKEESCLYRVTNMRPRDVTPPFVAVLLYCQKREGRGCGNLSQSADSISK